MAFDSTETLHRAKNLWLSPRWHSRRLGQFSFAGGDGVVNLLEAAIRLRHPEPVQSTPMIVVALIAVLINTVISVWLKSAARHDLNVRSAYLHMMVTLFQPQALSQPA